jgi:hypothetical protein
MDVASLVRILENVPAVAKISNRQSSEELLEINNREGNASYAGIWTFPYTMLKKDWSLFCLDLSFHFISSIMYV